MMRPARRPLRIQASALMAALCAGLATLKTWTAMTGHSPFSSWPGTATVFLVEILVWAVAVRCLPRLFKPKPDHTGAHHNE